MYTSFFWVVHFKVGREPNGPYHKTCHLTVGPLQNLSKQSLAPLKCPRRWEPFSSLLGPRAQALWWNRIRIATNPFKNVGSLVSKLRRDCDAVCLPPCTIRMTFFFLPIQKKKNSTYLYAWHVMPCTVGACFFYSLRGVCGVVFLPHFRHLHR
jgi:hypothetical protein